MVEKDLKGEKSISTEHVDNNMAIRKMLMNRGVKPEALPPSEDVKILQRKLKREARQIERDAEKTRKS